jgi:hypothetical protein
MSTPRRTRRQAPPPGVVLVALATAAVALAGGRAVGAPLSTDSESTTVLPGGFGDARGVCEAGTTAVAGGFETQFDPANPLTPRIATAGSRRSGRVWYSTSLNRGGSSGTLTTFAYCRDERIRLSFEKTAVAGGVAEATLGARCTNGTTAVSGGFYGELNVGGPTTQVIAHSSRRVGRRSWEVTAGNLGGDPGGLLSFVYCRDGEALKRATETALVGGGAPGFTVADVVARCKRGMRAISGGFDAPPAIGDQALLLASRKAGKRAWLVRVAIALPEGAPVTAYAYCEPT